jgi:C4-dicarboxylate-specific signal transduction histidine kinase
VNFTTAAATAIAAIASALIAFVAGRRTEEASAFDLFTVGAERILDRQSREIDELTDKVGALTAELRAAHHELGELRKQIQALQTMIRDLGHDPTDFTGGAWPA